MKTLKKVLTWIAAILIVGGIAFFLIEYLANRNLFKVLMSNSVVRGSLGVLKHMLIAVLMVIVGLLLLSLSFKIADSIKRKEEKQRLEEAQMKADQEALEARMEQVQQIAEEQRNQITGE